MLGGVKNFSVGICDGAPSTARSSFFFFGGGGGGVIKTGLFMTSFLCILGYFLKVNIQNGNSFFFGGGGGGLLKFQIFLGVCLIFLIFLGGKQKMLGPNLRNKKH